MPKLGQALWGITAPYFCCGLIVGRNGVVLEAAPIIRWTEGKRLWEVRKWCRRKGFDLYEISG